MGILTEVNISHDDTFVPMEEEGRVNIVRFSTYITTLISFHKKYYPTFGTISL